MTAEVTTGLRERALAAWGEERARRERQDRERAAAVAEAAADLAERMFGVRPEIEEDRRTTDEVWFEIDGLPLHYDDRERRAGSGGMALLIDCGNCGAGMELPVSSLMELGRQEASLAEIGPETLCGCEARRPAAGEAPLEERLVGVLRELIGEVTGGD